MGKNCMIKKYIKYIAVVFVIVLVCYYVKIKDCVYIKQCGYNLPLKINFKGWSTLGNVGSVPNPSVKLLSVLKYADRSRLLFRLEDYRFEKQIQQYISNDRGTTWQNVDWPLLGQSDVKSASSTRLVSRVDDRILYECYSTCKDGFPASTDGGETWTHVNPMLSNGDVIHAIQFMDTGMHLASRVYARIWTKANEERISLRADDRIPVDYDFRIGVSDDYGRHFSLLPDGIVMLSESRNNPLIRYGLILSSHFNVSNNNTTKVETKECLAVSKDEGKSWKAMEGSAEIMGQKLYEYGRESYVQLYRSWKKEKNDYELPYTFRPVQIESDPKRPGYIYVLTLTGPYFSRNMGKTFRFMNITDGWFNAVDRIAVDPLDGRYLYATVRREKIYRSSDYGCTWELIPLPSLQQ